MPDWAKTEHYDIIAKPAPGSNPTLTQRGEMMRNLFVERMKLVAHIEEEERSGFALVLARSDGRLGPNLKRSDLDCSQADNHCGGRMGIGHMEYTGTTLDAFARSVRGFAGGQVTNRTGLEAGMRCR